jgi:hypothetical protein
MMLRAAPPMVSVLRKREVPAPATLLPDQSSPKFETAIISFSPSSRMQNVSELKRLRVRIAEGLIGSALLERFRKPENATDIGINGSGTAMG